MMKASLNGLHEGDWSEQSPLSTHRSPVELMKATLWSVELAMMKELPSLVVQVAWAVHLPFRTMLPLSPNHARLLLLLFLM